MALRGKKPDLTAPGHLKGIVFGKAGAGKTWLACSLPNVYYIDVEGGATGPQYAKRLAAEGGAYMGREDGAGEPTTILAELKALASEQHGYKTVVIDSATKLWTDEIAKEQSRLGSDDVWGASKKPAVRTARQLASWIARLDMNVILVCHSVAEYGLLTDEKGKQKREQIGTQPDCHEKLVYEVNLVLEVESLSKGNRRAVIKKSRLEGFPDGDRFDIQLNGKDIGYEAIASRYGRENLEAAPSVITLATPEQVAEIERLLAVVKVDEKDLEKVLEKARAESWAELPTDKAQATIEWLKKKVIP